MRAAEAEALKFRDPNKNRNVMQQMYLINTLEEPHDDTIDDNDEVYDFFMWKEKIKDEKTISSEFYNCNLKVDRTRSRSLIAEFINS